MTGKDISLNGLRRRKVLIGIVLGSQVWAFASTAFADNLSTDGKPDAVQKVEQTLTLQGQVHRDAMELGSSGTAPTTASNREETDKLTGRVNDSAEAQKLSGATSDYPANLVCVGAN